MAIEHARASVLTKPWGVNDLRPWSAAGEGSAIGEIWYERPDKPHEDTALLLKLLFTSEPLSIQVHPNDAFAHSLGLPNGKTEAWYVLSAAPDAKVALGLSRRLTPEQLRGAIDDGSIADLIVWRAVSAKDVFLVPAGTIHAIGGGLVIAEIQQRSNATFRLFDPGRHRELHIENAILVADPGPADFQARPAQLTEQRTLLIASPHFAFERISLEAATCWYLAAERETWLLIISGNASAGSFQLVTGDALFAQGESVELEVGSVEVVGLIAYTGNSPVANLLQRRVQPGLINIKETKGMPLPISLTQTKAPSDNGRPKAIK